MALRNDSTLKKELRLAVTFASYVLVHEVLHIDSYDDDEIDATWYYEEEYLAMREDIQETRELIRNRKSIDEVTRSRRGIEGKTSLAEALHSVFREQESQRLRGTRPDEQLISAVYQQYAQYSGLDACLTGIADEEATRRPIKVALKGNVMCGKTMNSIQASSTRRERLLNAKRKQRPSLSLHDCISLQPSFLFRWRLRYYTAIKQILVSEIHHQNLLTEQIQ